MRVHRGRVGYLTSLYPEAETNRIARTKNLVHDAPFFKLNVANGGLYPKLELLVCITCPEYPPDHYMTQAVYRSSNDHTV